MYNSLIKTPSLEANQILLNKLNSSSLPTWYTN